MCGFVEENGVCAVAVNVQMDGWAEMGGGDTVSWKVDLSRKVEGATRLLALAWSGYRYC